MGLRQALGHMLAGVHAWSGRFLERPLHQAQVGHKGGSWGQGEADFGTMGTQRDNVFLGGWSLLLLLLGLVIPPASAQSLSYTEAALSAVDDLNQQSEDPNLYRLLELDQQPTGVSRDAGEGACSLARLCPTVTPFSHTLSLLSGFMSGSPQIREREWSAGGQQPCFPSGTTFVFLSSPQI